MGNNNPNIKGAPFKPQGGRPANFHSPTNLRGTVKSGLSVKTTLPKGYVSGKEHFMGTQVSGPKKIVTTLPRA